MRLLAVQKRMGQGSALEQALLLRVLSLRGTALSDTAAEIIESGVG